MVSFGLAQQKQLEDMTGSTSALQNINVMPTNYYNPASGEKPPRQGIITDDTISKIEKLSNVDSEIYSVRLDPYYGMKSVKFGKYDYYGDIVGMDEKLIQAADIEITEGRLFDPKSKDLEVIASPFVAYMLGTPNDIRGTFDPDEIELLNKTGVLNLSSQAGMGMGPGFYMDQGMDESMDQGMDESMDQSFASASNKNFRIKVVGMTKEDMFGGMPSIIAHKDRVEEINEILDKMNGVKNRGKKVNYYENIKVKVIDTQLIEDTAEEIRDLGLEASHDTEFIEQLNQGAMIMQAILGGIGGISLFVAAIGITNTMVMSIYERTKEIGVMKVIGAKVSDIRNLFLLEAGMIGLFGGIIGVGLSYGISAGLNSAFGSMAGEMGGPGAGSSEAFVSIIPISLALAALGICFLIGVVTGYYPAVRATKLSAIEAIKTE